MKTKKELNISEEQLKSSTLRPTKWTNTNDKSKKPKDLDWEKKLSYMEDETNTLFAFVKRKIGIDAWEMIKNIFIGEIKQTITQQRTELLEEIEKIIEVNVHPGGGYTDECDKDDLKNLIKNLLNKKDE